MKEEIVGVEEDVPAGGKILTQQQRRSLIDKVFGKDGADRVDFREPGKDLGFDFSPPRTVWEQFDMDLVPPHYRKFVRRLISENEDLFSRSDLDCGDISQTLGTYSLPLKGDPPTSSH